MAIMVTKITTLKFKIKIMILTWIIQNSMTIAPQIIGVNFHSYSTIESNSKKYWFKGISNKTYN
jgi:hypothetical protein